MMYDAAEIAELLKPPRIGLNGNVKVIGNVRMLSEMILYGGYLEKDMQTVFQHGTEDGVYLTLGMDVMTLSIGTSKL